MARVPALVLGVATCLSSNCLLADSIPDPKISLERGGGSTPIGLGAFSFFLDGQGGGIFAFCNNTAHPDELQTDCSNDGSAQGNWTGDQGVVFENLAVTSEFPEGQLLFTCGSGYFAFCIFALNGDGTMTVDFFGVGYYYSDGTAWAMAPDLQTNFGSNQVLNYFPGIAPGDHFVANFNTDPTCVATPDQPCQGNRSAGSAAIIQTGTPEPASWVLLATAGAMLAGRKRVRQARRRLAGIAARLL